MTKAALVVLLLVGVSANPVLAQSDTPHAAAHSTAVINCGSMTTEDRVEIAAAGCFGALLTAATPTLPQPAKIVLWLAYLSFLYGFLIYKLRRKGSVRMTFPIVLSVGLILISIASVIAWYVFPPEGLAASATAAPPKTDAADANVSADGIDKDSKPSDELEFYFHPFMMGGGRGNPDGTANIQYTGATMTNRSPRKMHLQMWAHAYYWDDEGKPRSIGFQPEWNPDGLTPHTGETTIDLDAFESKEGTLILFFDKPKNSGVERWNINPFKHVYVHVFDSVTGKHIAFSATPGYPDGKASWPLPPPAKQLALDFPRIDAAASQDRPALESLDLLARTQFFGYGNSDTLSISAQIENRSNSFMTLQINLLTRKSVDDTEWRTIRAVIKPSRKEDRGKLDYYALEFGPGDAVSCSLIFANTGFTNKKGEQLEENPSLTLLEIFDQQSRKKVWCAIEPGYPPGTDMRGAAIQAPPPIPLVNSDNSKQDKSNDTK